MKITNKKYMSDFSFDKKTLILGLGHSGYSCVRYLKKQNCPLTIYDSRTEPPYIKEVTENYSDIKILCGDMTDDLLKGYEQLVISPGISIRNKAIQKSIENGVLVVGDIAIFLYENQKNKKVPVIAVTGSNGKSTVVTLIDHMIRTAELGSIAGGNLGLPALDLLEQESDVYVLELSSFQLETIPDIEKNDSNLLLSATVLNISEDHMDRYEDLNDYQTIKEGIYNLTSYVVQNKSERDIQSNELTAHKKQFENQGINKEFRYFSNNSPETTGEYGIENSLNLVSMNKKSTQIWCKTSELKIIGQHNYENVLAALALIEPLKLSNEKIKQALKSYTGLAHRCEWVNQINGNDFYNDSKGTNVGATIAAIESFDPSEDIVLIAGGVGKDADFDSLARVIIGKVKHLVLIGRDALLIKSSVERAMKNTSKQGVQLVIRLAKTLKQAVELAISFSNQKINSEISQKTSKETNKKTNILFSPACASFDMFKNYNERGESFKAIVNLIAGNSLLSTNNVEYINDENALSKTKHATAGQW